MRDNLISNATSIAADACWIEFDTTVESFGSGGWLRRGWTGRTLRSSTVFGLPWRLVYWWRCLRGSLLRRDFRTQVLFRWKQELKPTAAPMFVTVHIADASAPCDAAPGHEERAP